MAQVGRAAASRCSPHFVFYSGECSSLLPTLYFFPFLSLWGLTSGRVCTQPDIYKRLLRVPGANQPKLGCGLLPGFSILLFCIQNSFHLLCAIKVLVISNDKNWRLITVFSVTKGLIWLTGTGPFFRSLIILHSAPGLIFEHREQPFHLLCSEMLHTSRR